MRAPSSTGARVLLFQSDSETMLVRQSAQAAVTAVLHDSAGLLRNRTAPRGGGSERVACDGERPEQRLGEGTYSRWQLK